MAKGYGASPHDYTLSMARQTGDLDAPVLSGHKYILRNSGVHTDETSLTEDEAVYGDLQSGYQVRTDRTGGIEVSAHLTAEHFDYHFESMLLRQMTTLQTINQAAGNITSVAAGNKLTASAGTFDPIEPGTIVELVGFTLPTYPGGAAPLRPVGFVSSVAPDGSELVIDPATLVLGDETPPDGASSVRSGPFSFPGSETLATTSQECFVPGADYALHFGQVATRVNVQRPETGIISASCKYDTPMGLDGNSDPATASVLTAEPAALTRRRPMNQTGVSMVFDHLGAITLPKVTASFTMERSLGKRPGEKRVGAGSWTRNKLMVSGELALGTSIDTTQIANIHQMYNDYRDGKPSRLFYYLTTPEGWMLFFVFYQVIYSNRQRSFSGDNVDLSGPWKGEPDDVFGRLCLYQTFPPLV